MTHLVLLKATKKSILGSHTQNIRVPIFICILYRSTSDILVEYDQYLGTKALSKPENRTMLSLHVPNCLRNCGL